MQKNKDFYHQSLQKLVTEMEKVHTTFKEESERLGVEWKDKRKTEFYNKQVQPRLDDLISAFTDMRTVAQQLKVIDDTLKRY